MPSKPKTRPLINLIQTTLDKIYSGTRYTSPMNSKSLNTLKRGISQSITDISTNNVNNIGEPNISRLYSRELSAIQKDSDTIKNIEDLFSDDGLTGNILSFYTENKWIRDMDDQINTILKYMPKLAEALDIRKSNVLCSDHFSRDFINVVTKSSSTDPDLAPNIEYLKDTYKLVELFDEAYENTATYGEQFIYIVPYNKAVRKLLDQEQKNTNPLKASIKLENGVLFSDTSDKMPVFDKSVDVSEAFGIKLNIEFDYSGIMSDVIKEEYSARRCRSIVSEVAINSSMYGGVINEANTNNDPDGKGTAKFDKKIVDDNLTFDKFDSDSLDGLIDLNKKDDNKNKGPINLNGSVVRKLEHENVLPIYIDDLSLGAYYIEVQDDSLLDNFRNSSSMSFTDSSIKKSVQKAANVNQQEELLQKISAQLSKYLDLKFINANADLRKEIYMILRANDILNNPNSKIKITFIPPEDLVHMYFKKDPKSHHGISDLDRSIIPATFYSSLYITNVIGALTRSNDRRVYYVKQTIDTNIAQVMLNTINQLKKGNFGIRQMDNINNVLGVLGRFNDFIIPMSATGEAPIQFEIMPRI